MAAYDDMDRMSPTKESPDSPPATARYPSVSTERVTGRCLSEDGRYMYIYKVEVIDLQAVRLLSHADQYERQAQVVCTLLARYIDYRLRADFCRLLRDLLAAGTVEVLTNSQGPTTLNILSNTGQSQLLRIIVGHMTPQKLLSMGQSEEFNTLKRLLLLHLRHQGQPISVNSLSVTLRRVVEELSG